jgi:hypothetical protein
MSIHILDIFIYLISIPIIWIFILPKQFKYEMGILAGIFWMIIYSIAYSIFFSFYNWSDLILNFIDYIKTINLTL